MLRLGAQCLALFQAHKDVTWTSGSGRTTRVQAMDRAHLHYAIAKGERGEYWDSGTRAKLPALKAEALRRILNDLGWTCMPWFGKGLDARLAATGDPG